MSQDKFNNKAGTPKSSEAENLAAFKERVKIIATDAGNDKRTNMTLRMTFALGALGLSGGVIGFLWHDRTLFSTIVGAIEMGFLGRILYSMDKKYLNEIKLCENIQKLADKYLAFDATQAKPADVYETMLKTAETISGYGAKERAVLNKRIRNSLLGAMGVMIGVHGYNSLGDAQKTNINTRIQDWFLPSRQQQPKLKSAYQPMLG